MAKIVDDKIVEVNGCKSGGFLDRQSVFDFLNVAGEAGWELISTMSGKTSHTYKLVFKRMMP